MTRTRLGRDAPSGVGIGEHLEGGTHWRRFVALLGIPLLLSGLVGWTLVPKVLAANLVLQNSNAKMTTSALYGVQSAIAVTNVTRQSGSSQRMLRFAFAQGKINDFCISEPVLGGLATLKMTAGDGNPGTWETNASNMILDLPSLSADISLDGQVNINQAGSTVHADKNPMNSQDGWFGIQAGFADVRKVSGTATDLQIPGMLKAPGLSITVVPGTSNCPAPAAPTGNPPAPGFISGTVTSAGAGLGGVSVQVYDADGYVVSTTTAANGTYRIYLLPGTYSVQFTKAGYPSSWFNGASSASSATPVTVGAGASVTGVNAAM